MKKMTSLNKRHPEERTNFTDSQIKNMSTLFPKCRFDIRKKTLPPYDNIKVKPHDTIYIFNELNPVQQKSLMFVCVRLPDEWYIICDFTIETSKYVHPWILCDEFNGLIQYMKTRVEVINHYQTNENLNSYHNIKLDSNEYNKLIDDGLAISFTKDEVKDLKDDIHNKFVGKTLSYDSREYNHTHDSLLGYDKSLNYITVEFEDFDLYITKLVDDWFLVSVVVDSQIGDSNLYKCDDRGGLLFLIGKLIEKYK